MIRIHQYVRFHYKRESKNWSKWSRPYNLQIKKQRCSCGEIASNSNSPIPFDRNSFNQPRSPIKPHRKATIDITDKIPMSPSSSSLLNSLNSKVLSSSNLSTLNNCKPQLNGGSLSPRRMKNYPPTRKSLKVLPVVDKRPSSRNIVDIQPNHSYKKDLQKLVLNQRLKLNFKQNTRQILEDNRRSKVKLKPLNKLQNIVVDNMITGKGSRKLFK